MLSAERYWRVRRVLIRDTQIQMEETFHLSIWPRIYPALMSSTSVALVVVLQDMVSVDTMFFGFCANHNGRKGVCPFEAYMVNKSTY